MKKVENPNAFKLMINKNLLTRMATAIRAVDRNFDSKKFISISPDLDPLELKPRVLRVRDQLKTQLPDDYAKALKTLLASLKSKNLSGFDLWPYTEFIQTYGLDQPEISLDALYEITQVFTAEFAVRPFIKKHPKLTLAYLKKCSVDKNVHVRRWASEGSRSRLPWGERLEAFVKDHEPTVPLLENLKFDEELYVRKSVSNHLNDMAKDHPDMVIEILRKWKKQAGTKHEKKVTWIIHRALRTLIKDGHPKALELVGAFQNLKIEVSPLKLNKKSYKMGDRIEFNFAITSKSKQPQKLVVDYVIHFLKANQKTAPKVFKLKNFELKPLETMIFKKSHHLKQITTRVYYPGMNDIQIQVNGKPYDKLKWTLEKF